MPLQFAFFVCSVVLSLSPLTAAEVDYKPNLYIGKNEINANSYSDNNPQPVNSYLYNAPLQAYENTAKQQQQQSAVNGYNYNSDKAQNQLPNSYNNNNNGQQQQTQQQQQQQQQQEKQTGQHSPSHAYTYASSAQTQPTSTGYPYSPQNLAALSTSPPAGGFVGPTTNTEGSFNAQARQILTPVATPNEEYNPATNYNYSYSVHDESTGDIKSHTEARNGYFVQGSYSVVDPDGFQRTVSYTVDGPSGFQAVVKRVPYVLRSVASNARAPSTPFITTLSEVQRNSNSAVAQSSGGSMSSKTAAQKESGDGQLNILPEEKHESYARPPADARDGRGSYQ